MRHYIYGKRVTHHNFILFKLLLGILIGMVISYISYIVMPKVIQYAIETGVFFGDKL